MPLSPHTIKPGKRTKKNVKRLGRGNASGKGTYASRGLKGQRARSGGKGGLQLRGFRQSLQKVPKLRGFKSKKVKPETITLAALERVCEAGQSIDPYKLAELGLVDDPKKGVKIVASGTLTKKLSVTGCVASKGALEQIEKAGGTLTF